MAVTATATEQVASDILRTLGIPRAPIFKVHPLFLICPSFFIPFFLVFFSIFLFFFHHHFLPLFLVALACRPLLPLILTQSCSCTLTYKEDRAASIDSQRQHPAVNTRANTQQLASTYDDLPTFSTPTVCSHLHAGLNVATHRQSLCERCSRFPIL